MGDAQTMRTATLLRRSLVHFWRTNLAVVAGVATTVAVLAGALLVGDSVRASLRDLFLLRLGNTAYVISADGFFRENLAAEIQAHSGFRGRFRDAAPLIALEGIVTHETRGRRASGVQVYGVDQRFWNFHDRAATATAPDDGQVLVSASLAEEFAAAAGDWLLVRVEKPSPIPVESLHGNKDELGRTIRLRVCAILSASDLGEFSLRPQQGAVRAVFVPLRRLQQDLKQESRANAILVSESGLAADTRAGDLDGILKETFSLEDLGVRLRILNKQKVLSLESDKILIEDHLADAAHAAATRAAMRTTAIFTYLATSIRARGREIPYSLVTALDPVEGVAALSQTPKFRVGAAPRQVSASGNPPTGPATLPPIWLNTWASGDLAARPGDVVTLEYYLWEEAGRLVTRTAEFVLQGTVPTQEVAADPHFAPQFPGITDSPGMSDWNPPFPIQLKRIRPRDEDYWERYRTAPKAFIPLEVGQRLWSSRFGKRTALRFHPAAQVPPEASLQSFQKDLRAVLNAAQSGFAVYAARAEGAEASRGAVNFGEYFVYFSFFLVASALLLTGLFFRLGVEQRLREIGLLLALGFSNAKVDTLFFVEGVALALFGCLSGLVGASAYAALMMFGLRTWWFGAVGTTDLRLHVLPGSLVLGGVGGLLAALLSIAWMLRDLRPVSPRSLLAGSRQLSAPEDAGRRQGPNGQLPRRVLLVGLAAAFSAFALLLGTAMNQVTQVAAFFGSGSLLLLALLCFEWAWLARRGRPGALHLQRSGLHALLRLGFRNATWRPGRSLLCMALMASATFVIVAVGAFRRDTSASSQDRNSGTGGFSLLAETLLPIPYDLNTPAGKLSLSLSDRDISALEGVKFFAFRLRPGDDASCLNLYQPRNPRILGLTSDFIASGRFYFQDSLARTPEEKHNPWRLLEAESADGAIPAIADANSLTYILHRRLGEEIVLNESTGRPVRLRLVAALADSFFQGELLVSEKNLLRAFPHEQGFRFFLMDVAPHRAGDVAGTLEQALSDYGFDAVPTAERLAAFHRVENTYLSTFQTLGGLGLLLGTLGLAAVMLRNVLERRRELALLRAVGFRPADLAFLVVAENALLLFCGLLSGVVSALLAIAPALFSRGGSAPAFPLGLLLAVLLTGLATSLLAVAAVLRSPLIPALRTE